MQVNRRAEAALCYGNTSTNWWPGGLDQLVGLGVLLVLGERGGAERSAIEVDAGGTVLFELFADLRAEGAFFRNEL